MPINYDRRLSHLHLARDGDVSSWVRFGEVLAQFRESRKPRERHEQRQDSYSPAEAPTVVPSMRPARSLFFKSHAQQPVPSRAMIP